MTNMMNQPTKPRFPKLNTIQVLKEVDEIMKKHRWWIPYEVKEKKSGFCARRPRK